MPITAVGYAARAAGCWRFRQRSLGGRIASIQTGTAADRDPGGDDGFLGDSNVVAGVTSFGINGNCAGTGGVYRVDRGWNLDWLSSEFGEHL
ncbi:MAG: hypothetical protein ACRDG7_15695 [Candidatus Limnocylindria bacterium]